VGLRSATRAWFATGAIGIARARSFKTCECSGPGSTRTDPPVSAFAFEAKAFSGVSVSQVGLSVYGVAGAHRVSYLAGVLSVNFGWFGK